MNRIRTKCINWQKAKDKRGYGHKRRKDKIYFAHRLAYCDHHGLNITDIDNICVRHKCDNPSCVNPEHLELGTHKQNMADMVERGRSASGERAKWAKLTEKQVREIRERYVPKSKIANMSALAKEYGVSPSTISLIVNFKHWKSTTTTTPSI